MSTPDIKLICFYGPESTGKSTMTKRMAEFFQTEFVPEVAREMILSNDFSVEDIIKIGKAQVARTEEKIKSSNKILFCDTDLITTQIYSKKYLGVIPEILTELENKIHYHHYFLFDIDVPWVADGLRDLGEQREKMMSIFKEELKKRNIQSTLVHGDWNEREEIIKRKIKSLLN